MKLGWGTRHSARGKPLWRRSGFCEWKRRVAAHYLVTELDTPSPTPPQGGSRRLQEGPSNWGKAGVTKRCQPGGKPVGWVVGRRWESVAHSQRSGPEMSGGRHRDDFPAGVCGVKGPRLRCGTQSDLKEDTRDSMGFN